VPVALFPLPSPPPFCYRASSPFSRFPSGGKPGRAGVETGIRDLKNNLSRYIRRIEAGERVVVTARGRVVAELVPPGAGSRSQRSEFDRLVACGTITPPIEDGDPLEGCPEIRLPPAPSYPPPHRLRRVCQRSRPPRLGLGRYLPGRRYQAD
jgi:prevent-host-death family protein